MNVKELFFSGTFKSLYFILHYARLSPWTNTKVVRRFVTQSVNCSFVRVHNQTCGSTWKTKMYL